MKGQESIENRIRRKREEYGYKQSDLALLLGHGCSSQVSSYERGQILPDPENLLKLCYILNALPEWLYPEITEKWKREIENAKKNLKKLTSHERREN